MDSRVFHCRSGLRSFCRTSDRPGAFQENIYQSMKMPGLKNSRIRLELPQNQSPSTSANQHALPAPAIGGPFYVRTADAQEPFPFEPSPESIARASACA